MTELKGAAATSLYGSCAAEGEKIITFCSGGGLDGRNFSITYSGNVEASRGSLLPDILNFRGLGWNGLYTYIENGSGHPELDGSRQVYLPSWNYSHRIRDFPDISCMCATSSIPDALLSYWRI